MYRCNIGIPFPQALLNRNPLQRLGASGGAEVRAHQFFASINWEDLYERKITPPFNPMRNQTAAGALDTSNFEREFTNMPVSVDAGSGVPREERRLDSDTFLNFTYEEESHLNSLIEDLAASRSKK